MIRALGGVALLAAVAALVYALPGRVSAPAREWFDRAETPVRVLFVGDLMLDRNVARSAAQEGIEALFSTSTLALFKDADVRVANLEGTITANPSLAQRNNKILRFTFDPQTAAAALRYLQLTAVSLANNHALDFYDTGYAATRTRVQTSGTAPFGHPLNATGTLSTIVESRGKTICLVGYHSLFDADTTTVLGEIQALRSACWRVVVVAHWGEEYTPVANDAQKGQARSFVDAGADLVIGAHPHVVQDRETYKGKAIFYSLGNFMFDQNFSWETTHGLAVRADFYEGKTAFTLTPLTIEQQHSSVAAGANRDRILKAVGEVAEFSLP